MRASIAAVAVVCLALLITGCAASAPVGQEASPDRSFSAEAAEGSGVGEVSYDAYRAGFDQFEFCIKQAGYSLTNVEESDSIIRFSIPSAAVESQIADRCYETHFQALDQAWQLAHEDTSESAHFLRNCLAEAGLDSTGTMQELAKRATDAGIDLAACLERMD